MKTHFCHIMKGYDDNEPEYVGKSFCGLSNYEKGSNSFKYVDCKKCLKKARIDINADINALFKDYNKSHEEGGNCPTITS